MEDRKVTLEFLEPKTCIDCPLIQQWQEYPGATITWWCGASELANGGEGVRDDELHNYRKERAEWCPLEVEK